VTLGDPLDTLLNWAIVCSLQLPVKEDDILHQILVLHPVKEGP
jgi:hypothetical protein